MKKLLVVVALAFLFITGCTTWLHWGERDHRDRRDNQRQEQQDDQRDNRHR
jgi:hypothetical protein